MKPSKILNALVAATALPLLYLANISPSGPLRLTAIREAHAIVGAPMSPLSVADVARRTTVGAASASAASTAAVQQQAAAVPPPPAVAVPPPPAAAAAPPQQSATAPPQQPAAERPPGEPAVGSVVNTLPAGCKPEAKSGVEYQNCGGVYYRAAFQGNNLVYVVQ